MVLFIDIANEMQCDPQSVRRWVRDQNIKFDKQFVKGKWSKSISDEDAQLFKEWWLSRGVVPEGFVPMNDLAKECGVDRKTVRMWAEANGANFGKYFAGKGGKESLMIDSKSAETFKSLYRNANQAVAVDELLDKHKCNWRAANRWSKRTGIPFVKIKSGGRSKKGLLPEQAGLFEEYLKDVKEGGYFYLIQLLPECLPGRVKFGWAYLPATRLAVHRITCPNARLVGQWKCLRHEEKQIIKAITKDVECLPLTSEVFDFKEFEKAITLTEAHFTSE